jgi:Flp pilus assembly protein CpaB
MKPLRLLDRVRRRVLVHRRVLGALCAGVAVWLVVETTAGPPPATAPVWTAARDLPSGTVLDRHDVTLTAYAPDSVPAAAIGSASDLRAMLGRTLATPLGAGEPLTPAHLAGAERLAGFPGRAAVAVRLPDPGVAALLTPGQRVTLVASDPQGGRAPERLVDDAAVLAVPRESADDASGGLTGRLVLFAVPAEEVEQVAAAGTTRYLSVVWSR